MESGSDHSPLIVIAGETASGKSALALDLAQQFNGEIIAADSRTVYRGMDIGTAKPAADERAAVPHHLLDVAAPDQPLTAADFKRLAEKAIDDIANRGKVPFLVGGTGLYIDAILYDFTFSSNADEKKRQLFQELTVEQLQQKVQEEGIPMPVNNKNPRHLIRQLETGGVMSQRKELRQNSLVIGVLLDREDLKARIAVRTDKMLQSGLAQETKKLVDRYGWDCPALQTIGYQEFAPYFKGETTIEDVRGAIIRNTLQYAKRQRTWFRRNKSIHWICKQEESVDLITTLLNKAPTAKQ